MADQSEWFFAQKTSSEQ